MPQGKTFKPEWKRLARVGGWLLAAGASLIAGAAQAEEAAAPAVLVAAAPDATALAAVSLQAPQRGLVEGAQGRSALPADASAPQAAAPDAQALETETPAPATAVATDAAPQGGPGLIGLHSEITFSVLSAPRQQGQDPQAAAYQTQVKRIGSSLANAARGLYPEAMGRIGAFDVYVADSADLSTMSSATGKVAINAGFAALNPTDDWMAFVIAREMGHVVSGHHDSNSGASLAVSILMNLVVPGSGLIKSAISFAGSQLASSSGRERQVKEADDVALKLLEAAGYTTKAVALNLRLNPLGENISTTSWAGSFRESAARLTATLPAKAPATQQAASGLLAGAEVQSAPLMPTAAARPVRWQPEELVRPRPSGLPGTLMMGGQAVPVRRVE